MYNCVRKLIEIFTLGVVLGGEISANYPEGTELKLVICLESTDSAANTASKETSVQFTASVHTDLEQIVAKTLSGKQN